MRPRLLIITTVPCTLAYILRQQPRYLSQYFDVLLASSPGPEIDRVTGSEGLPVHLVPMRRSISPFRDLVSLYRLIALFQRVRPDMVHSFTPKAGLLSMLAGAICGIPVRIHTFTGLVFPTAKGLRQRLLIATDRLLCACATNIVPEGRGVAEDLRAFRITAKPLRVIGFGNIAGVDIEYYSPHAQGIAMAAEKLRRQFDIGGNDFVYGFVGRLNREKGVAELFQAFSRMPLGSRLLLAGDGDESSPLSSELMQMLRNHPRVHFLGFLPDVRPVYMLADVVVLPSYREGFPNTVLQAGAMERPVVASDISGCNEVIEPGFNGWLVPAHDALALEGAMREACMMPVVGLLRMGSAARQRVIQRFEQKQHWQRMVSFYKTVSPLRADHDSCASVRSGAGLTHGSTPVSGKSVPQ